MGHDAGNLECLTNVHINAIKAILGLSRTASSADSVPSLVLSARQVELNKRLDRVLRDVEAKSTDLARFCKLNYKPINETTVEKYHIGSKIS